MDFFLYSKSLTDILLCYILLSINSKFYRFHLKSYKYIFLDTNINSLGHIFIISSKKV